MHILYTLTTLTAIYSKFLACITVIPPFFGTHCTGLTHSLSLIGKIIPKSRSFTIYFFTTSIILGFSLRCLSLTGSALTSKMILCMHIEGLIPLISAIDHPKVVLHSVNTSMSCCSWSAINLEEMMAGRVLLGPKKAYLSSSERTLSSS